jgi:hypothetical protein
VDQRCTETRVFFPVSYSDGGQELADCFLRLTNHPEFRIISEQFLRFFLPRGRRARGPPLAFSPSAPLRTICRLVPRRDRPVTYTYKLSRRLASGHETIRIIRPLVLLALFILATACGTVPR